MFYICCYGKCSSLVKWYSVQSTNYRVNIGSIISASMNSVIVNNCR